MDWSLHSITKEAITLTSNNNNKVRFQNFGRWLWILNNRLIRVAHVFIIKEANQWNWYQIPMMCSLILPVNNTRALLTSSSLKNGSAVVRELQIVLVFNLHKLLEIHMAVKRFCSLRIQGLLACKDWLSVQKELQYGNQEVRIFFWLLNKTENAESI